MSSEHGSFVHQASLSLQAAALADGSKTVTVLGVPEEAAGMPQTLTATPARLAGVAALPSRSTTVDSGLSGGLCVVLVDFDNFVPPGQRVLSPELFAHELLALVRRIRRKSPAPGYFLVRLYGGWYSDGTLTSVGSQVAQLIAASPLFPLIDGQGLIVRGDIQLVNELLALPRIKMNTTYRRRGGLPRLRLSSPGTPTGCPIPDAGCPITGFHRVTQKKHAQCPDDRCSVGVADAFIVHEQKMVDTLLACDLLEASSQGVERIVLVTSDSDLFTAHSAGKQLGAERLLVVGDEGSWSQEHLDILHSVGIATANRSEES